MFRLKLILLFLTINFGGLAVGSWLMDKGPSTSWYLDLNKAPWTPPGWVFGAAWTTIMICFSIYIAFVFKRNNNKELIGLFTLQFILNVSWNYIFFNQHMLVLGLINILLLTLLTFFLLFRYKTTLKLKSILIMPYCLWLCIASSLNFYIVLFN
ncbi:MAG: benzodiazapine receptor [Ulvibacter sp.]|jgi:benzodiazapine receptor